jgi:hypothetical protein
VPNGTGHVTERSQHAGSRASDEEDRNANHRGFRRQVLALLDNLTGAALGVARTAGATRSV